MPISNLSTVLDAVTAIQAALTITSPITASIKKAHRYPPNRNSVLPDTPCWMNGWTFARQDDVDFDGNEKFFYTINCQLFVEDADISRGADIATAFHQAWVDALLADTTLGSSANGLTYTPRGGDPTLVVLEWGGKGYVGLNEYLDVEFFI